MDEKELKKRFTYHPPKDELQLAKYDDIRDFAKDFAELLIETCPESRELSLALTNLEQVVFWANAAVARAE